MRFLGNNLIFEYNGELWAVHRGAIYSWHGNWGRGHVGCIPRAHVAMHKGLSHYGMSGPLGEHMRLCFQIAINEWKRGQNV